MDNYLRSTHLLNFNHPTLVDLVDENKWMQLSQYKRIEKIYDFVQNKMLFGYNEADNIPASKVYDDGYGQCNTKGTLLMALLRKCNIPCRFHAFTIDKQLQKGAISGILYTLAPKNIIHSWIEIWFEGRWINLEGFILDKPYLESIQSRFSDIKGDFSGYAVATQNLSAPPIDWNGSDTYIQKEGINHDYGIFDSPDDFYKKHGSNLSGIKHFLFKHIFRKWMNYNVSRIRHGKW